MKIISCGPSEYECGLIESLPDKTKWVVYWYLSDSYDGSGYAYCYADKKYYAKSLGHCSCFGPWSSDSHSWDVTSKDEILNRDLAGNDQMTLDFKKVFNKIFRNKKI